MCSLVRNWHLARISVLVVLVLGLPNTHVIKCHIGLINMPPYFCIVSCHDVELLLSNSRFHPEKNYSLKDSDLPWGSGLPLLFLTSSQNYFLNS